MSQTSFALPARQVTFGAGRSQYQQQQAQQAQQQAQAAQQAQQQQQQAASQYYRQPAPTGGLALPGPGPATQAAASKAATTQPSSYATPGALAGPSTPAATAVPATPAPLTLEQQHITAVEGIVPTLQNIVATVNLDCRLDLKTIALHARNAEYNREYNALVVDCWFPPANTPNQPSVLRPSSCVSASPRPRL